MCFIAAHVLVNIAETLHDFVPIGIAGSIWRRFVLIEVGVFGITLLLPCPCNSRFFLLLWVRSFSNIICPVLVSFSVLPCFVIKANGFSRCACTLWRNNPITAANGNVAARIFIVSFIRKAHRFITAPVAWSVWFLCRDDLWRNYRLYLMVFAHHIIFNRLQNVLVNLHCS